MGDVRGAGDRTGAGMLLNAPRRMLLANVVSCIPLLLSTLVTRLINPIHQPLSSCSTPPPLPSHSIAYNHTPINPKSRLLLYSLATRLHRVSSNLSSSSPRFCHHGRNRVHRQVDSYSHQQHSGRRSIMRSARIRDRNEEAESGKEGEKSFTYQK